MDDNQRLEEFSNLPGFTTIHTSVPTVEIFPDQSVLTDDFDMSVLLKEYDYFPTQVEWTAPSGTKQTYKVYQRADIDWDLVRSADNGPRAFRSKTNREAALFGIAPELPDGSYVNLHHLGQDSRGPLVEVSTKHHSFDNPKAFKSLHNQFEGKKHPKYPVQHDTKWRSDVKEYWKDRGRNEHE